MCYKEERHRKLSIALSEKTKDIPNFISDFFDRYKSAATKNCNWGYIRDMLLWMIAKGYIKRSSLSEISTEDMNAVTSNHIIKYFNELRDGITGRKNSSDSICTKKNVFNAFWNYMLLNKYVDDNIIQHISRKLYKPETEKKEIKVPTSEQLDAFICELTTGNNNEFTIIRNLTIVKLILGSGIRSEELINLDIKDLYIDGGNPYIKILGKGKTEHYDTVLISQTAKSYLQDYLKYRDRFVLEKQVDDNALFLSNDRCRISKTSITSFFNRYSEGNINPHMLRHWVVTELYKQTKDIVLVQRQLRHHDPETTAKYYVHISADNISAAVARL